MTLGDINAKVYSLTHTDIGRYSDAAMLIDINLWYQKIVSMIFESQDDSDFDDQRKTDYPIVKTAMVAGQRDYTMPVSEQVQKIKRVDVTYDGVNWYRATPFDNGTVGFGMGNATNEDMNMIKQSPRYDVQYNALFIYPLAVAADVTAGAQIRVEWERAVTPFSQAADYNASTMSTSTTVPGIDITWHPMLAYGAAYEFANANNLPQLANFKQDLQDWEARLRTAYGRKNLDSVLSLRPAYDSYGDYGSTGAGGYLYGR
jgi:hypothetical protein